MSKTAIAVRFFVVSVPVLVVVILTENSKVFSVCVRVCGCIRSQRQQTKERIKEFSIRQIFLKEKFKKDFFFLLLLRIKAIFPRQITDFGFPIFYIQYIEMNVCEYCV